MRRCRHCGQYRVTRPRGLCWRCHRTPGVRDLHPVTSKFGQRGMDPAGRLRQPPEPTQALPGSVEKIIVLRERVRLGLELWHPEDAPLPRRPLRRVG